MVARVGFDEDETMTQENDFGSLAVEVDGATRYPKFGDPIETGCGGWRLSLGRLGGSGSSPVALKLWTTPEYSSLFMLDAINAQHDGVPVDLLVKGNGAQLRLWPGAGISIGPISLISPKNVEADAFGEYPVARDALGPPPNAELLGDLCYTGATGSPRNRFVSGISEWADGPNNNERMMAVVVAANYSAFQVSRRMQRVPRHAEWSIADRWGFDVCAFHEDAYPKAVSAPTVPRVVPPAKWWPREKRSVWTGNQYGTQQVEVDTYRPTHGPELVELLECVVRYRDPRAYDQLRQAALGFAAWDWDCSPSGGSPFGVGFGGGGGFDFGQNSRVKGRAILALVRFLQAARSIGAADDEKVAFDLLSMYVDRVGELWTSGLLPSSSEPRNDHLTVPFDCAYFVAVLAWGLGLAAEVGVSSASFLANRACDALSTVFWDGGDRWFVDVPSPSPDWTISKPWPASSLGTGTHRWLAYAFFAARRSWDKCCVRILEIAAAKGQPIADPIPAMFPKGPTPGQKGETK
jgi:hypothetical protein